MTNTAISAKNKKTTHTITFKNKEHKKFYYEYLQLCKLKAIYKDNADTIEGNCVRPEATSAY
ncbi:MAG: hypothetical protein PHS74_13475 [Lachnospiraceae bacterium]|nr:hypothetical protein [Lachnospiraceae bacterium]